MYSTLSTLTCPIHTLFREADCMICHQDLSSSTYPDFTATMAGPYQQVPQMSFQAPAATMIGPEPRRTTPQVSIITNIWCGPLKSEHDHYPERLALSPEDRVQMFVGKYSCDDLALSPVRAEEGSENDGAFRIRRRQRASKKQDPIRVTRGSRVSKSTRVADLNPLELPLPPKRLYKFRDGRPTKRSREALDKIRLQRWKARTSIQQNESTINASAFTSPHTLTEKTVRASKQEKATKLKERALRRSQRARRGPSPQCESGSESEEPASRASPRALEKNKEPQSAMCGYSNVFLHGRAVTRSKAQRKAA
ncbi:hypothetical protein JHW43_005247 [Diplocarpon mali]|nr:hypothetical protein JHW43_005247 [Diplocarpon mali]